MDTVLFNSLMLALAGLAAGAWLAFALPRMIEARRRLALLRRERREDLRRR